MGMRRWECVKEILITRPNYIKELERIRVMTNHDWYNQIERMKKFQAEENHTYFITFNYLCVHEAKTYRDIQIDSISYAQNTDEFKVITSKLGEKTLISLEIISFNDKYYLPESADDIAACSFWK